jgi:hypothetical protein
MVRSRLKLADVALVLSLAVAAQPGLAAEPELINASDGAAIAADAIEAALARDSVEVSLAAGDQLRIADLRLAADGPSRAMISLSSEFLTIAVTSGRISVDGGRAARAGQALVVALDSRRVERLAFDAERLQSTLTPGAGPLVRGELEQLARRQRRGAFWGAYEPLQVNARVPGPIASEAVRASYLSEPVVLGQRRAAAGQAGDEVRLQHITTAFLAAYSTGDAAGLAALLDPAPFLAESGVRSLTDRRREAAASLLADPALRAALAGATIGTAAADGRSAVLQAGAARWRLNLVARDRALFISSLEPIS